LDSVFVQQHDEIFGGGAVEAVDPAAVGFAFSEHAPQLDADLGGFPTGGLADHVGDGHQAAVLLVLVAPVGRGGVGVAIHLAVRIALRDAGQSDADRDDQRDHAHDAGRTEDAGEHNVIVSTRRIPGPVNASGKAAGRP
jgi:hypothetical protein